MSDPVVIIGSGLAGFSVARELRKRSDQVPIKMITAASGDFYSKPHLSNAFKNNKTAQQLIATPVKDIAEKLKLDIISHVKVEKIDAQNKKIYVEKKVHRYQSLVLACGADPILLPLKGAAVSEVLCVNNLADYALLREKLKTKKRVLIIGAGLVGCEFANDLTHAGHSVAVVTLDVHPLAQLVPESIGAVCFKALAEEGIRWHFNSHVVCVDYVDSELKVGFADGSQVTTDAVLSAVGLRPHVALARTANLEVNRGVVVNDYLQTSDHAIYALGDCAEVSGKLRLFVAPILHCARALAQSLAGKKMAVVFPLMPIVIKTPACPIVVCMPEHEAAGHWDVAGNGRDYRACYYNSEDKLIGFVLTGEQTKLRAGLIKTLPHCNN